MTIKNARAKVGATASIGNGDRWRWMEKGVCSQRKIDLTEIEDIEDGKKRREVAEYYKKELCGNCPVLVTCLTYIVQQEHKDKLPSSGLWGKTYAGERNPLRRAFRDTTIPIETLVERFLAKKALYNTKYLLTATVPDTKEFLKEINVETEWGIRIMQGKLRKEFTFPVTITVLDTETGKSEIVDPSLPRVR